GLALGEFARARPLGAAVGRHALGPELTRRVRGEVDHHAMAVDTAHASALVQLAVLVDSLELGAHAAPLNDCPGIAADPAAAPPPRQSWEGNSRTNGYEVPAAPTR